MQLYNEFNHIFEAIDQLPECYDEKDNQYYIDLEKDRHIELLEEELEKVTKELRELRSEQNEHRS